ncbi:hypothetical protein QOZ80_5BG0439200 [Eleusine coracana subsp. coracana]|nr:hypothetical protein QOZ80_5BG0439200 [Eleusine coracana subsp. coracana]
MEVTPLSVGKSVLDGALGYTKSTIAEEVALQLGIASDHAFIRDELDMMRSFLMVAHEERNEQNKVLTTWVNQVRDVAYDTEDCLQDCSIHLHRPSWWRLPRTLGERRRIAKKMKELRAKVEDVSQRNLRYGLIKGSCSKPATAPAHSDMVSATMSAMEESWWQQDKAKEGLIQLTDNTDEDLRVIAVCGASGLLGETSIVRKAYNDLKGKDRFKCHAWVRIVHPFNQTEFLQNIIRQFYVDLLDEMAKVQNKSDPAIQSLLKTGRMKGDALLDGFINYLHGKSYLIVLADLSSMQEWDQIKACFPNNKKGSRLIVCTEHVEVASLCTVPETVLPNHKQLSTDQTLYVFYEKDLQDGTGATELGSATRANENKGNIYKLKTMEDDDAHTLFTIKVFNKSIDLSKHAELNEEAKLILKKCGGLPLAIVTIGRQVDPSGVLLPRGVRKLKALHTLGAVNIARGKAILHDISKLSQLRKLEVTGVNKRNCVQLCLVFVHLSRLDSLSLQSLMMDEDLCGCLDTSCSPPKSLESLKLVIKLVELPRWIGDLQNLVKLKLEGTFLVRPSATIRVLGKLPKLSILCLSWCTFDCRDLRLNFHRVLLPSLVVLQLLWIDHDVRSVEFAGTTMPKLELLRFHSVTEEIGAGLISGLESLPSLKALELLDNRTCEEDFLEDVKAQLAKNANRPILKRCNI